MHIPLWPGIRLSLWEPQSPEAVHVTMASYYKPLNVTRVASKRGWALLLVRYDWRDHGTYEPDVRDREVNRLRDQVARVREAANDLDWMAASTASFDDRQTYRAIAAGLRRRLDDPTQTQEPT